MSDYIYSFVLTFIIFVNETKAISCPSSYSEEKVVDICSAIVLTNNHTFLNVSSRRACQCKITVNERNVSITPIFKQVEGSTMKPTNCGMKVLFTLEYQRNQDIWNVMCNSRIDEIINYPYYTNQSIIITTVLSNVTGNTNAAFCIELRRKDNLPFELECGNRSESHMYEETVIQNVKDDQLALYLAVGSTIGALILVLLLIFVVIVKRRRISRKNSGIQKQRSDHHENDCYEDDELKYNVLYQSSANDVTKSKNQQADIYENNHAHATSTVEKSVQAVVTSHSQAVAFSNDNTKKGVDHIIAPGSTGCEYAVVNKTGSKRLSDKIPISVSYETRKESLKTTVDLQENASSDGNGEEKRKTTSKIKLNSVHYEEVNFD